MAQTDIQVELTGQVNDDRFGAQDVSVTLRVLSDAALQDDRVFVGINLGRKAAHNNRAVCRNHLPWSIRRHPAEFVSMRLPRKVITWTKSTSPCGSASPRRIRVHSLSYTLKIPTLRKAT